MKMDMHDIRLRLKSLSENTAPDYRYQQTLRTATNLLDENASVPRILECIRNSTRENCIYKEALFDLFDEVIERGTAGQIRQAGNYICNEWVSKTRDAKDTQRYIHQKLGRMTGKVSNKVQKNIQNAMDSIKNAVSAGKNNFNNNMTSIKQSLPNNKAPVSAPAEDKTDEKEEAVAEAYTNINLMAFRMYQADRIIENYNTFSKRFNIDRLIKENVRINGVEDTVASICNFIETYNLDDEHKFSMVLEACWYGFNKNYIPFDESSLATVAADYFMSKGRNNSMCKRILEASLVVEPDDYKGNMELIQEEEPEEDVFEEKTLTSKDRKEIPDSEYGLPSKKKYPMPDESHVRSAIAYFNKCDKEDQAELARNIKKRIKHFGMEVEVSDSNPFSKYYNENTYDPEYGLANNGDIQHFIAEMDTAANKKRETDFERILNKYRSSDEEFKETKLQSLIRHLYAKNANQIVEGTPKLLNYIRLTFIVGTCAINPVIAAVGLIADIFIRLHVERDNAKKMVTVFDKEIKTTKTKLESAKNATEKERLQRYLDSLKEGRNKIDEYYEGLLSDDELDAKYDEDHADDDDFDDEYIENLASQYSDEDDDDDFDFDDDEDYFADEDFNEAAGNRKKPKKKNKAKYSYTVNTSKLNPVQKAVTGVTGVAGGIAGGAIGGVGGALAGAGLGAVTGTAAGAGIGFGAGAMAGAAASGGLKKTKNKNTKKKKKSRHEAAIECVSILSNIMESKTTFEAKEITKESCDRILSNIPDMAETLAEISKMYPEVIGRDTLSRSLHTIESRIMLKEINASILDKYAVKNAIREMNLIENSDRKTKDIFYETKRYAIATDILECLIELDAVCAYRSPMTEASFTNSVKLAVEALKQNMRKLSDKEKAVSKTIDTNSNNFKKAVERSFTTDNREAVIKGSMLPSASKVIKGAIASAATALFIHPAIAIIGVLGYIGVNKKYKAKERQMVIDEIETELKMTEKYIEIAERKEDMKALKNLYTIQKELERQRQRIKYKMKVDFGQKYYDTDETMSDMR